MEDNKHPLKWFEDRIGEFIFREPYFKDEIERGKPVPIKVSTKDHALKLYDLQRNDRPPYMDGRIIGYGEYSKEKSNGTISKR